MATSKLFLATALMFSLLGCIQAQSVYLCKYGLQDPSAFAVVALVSLPTGGSYSVGESPSNSQNSYYRCGNTNNEHDLTGFPLVLMNPQPSETIEGNSWYYVAVSSSEQVASYPLDDLYILNVAVVGESPLVLDSQAVTYGNSGGCAYVDTDAIDLNNEWPVYSKK